MSERQPSVPAATDLARPSKQWRCTECGRLLGVRENQRLRIRFSRVYDYLVGLPATSVCPRCQSLNET